MKHGLNVWKRICDQVRGDRQKYDNNIDRVHIDRRHNLKILFAALVPIVFVLSHLGFFIPFYQTPQPYFMAAFAVILVITGCALIFRGSTATLIETYLVEAVMMVVTTLIGNTMGRTVHSISFIVMFCLLPITVFDRIPRKVLISLSFLAMNILLSWNHKDSSVVGISTAVCLAIIAGSSAMGYSLQRAKLLNYELIRESDYAKRHDFLTGLNNRLQLDDLINGVGKYEGKTATMAFISDIDCYKGFNDTYGHIAGDECLRQIGAVFSEYSSSHNIEFFRYGGEEILAIGFDTIGDLDTVAGRYARDLLECVRSLGIKYDAMPAGVVTVSVGYTVGFTDIGTMIDCADKAMYQAKAAGRNCTRKFYPERPDLHDTE